MENNNKHGLTDADISRIWDAFRSGKPVEAIAKDEGIKGERVERVTSAITEVFEDDVPLMIADRRAGMTKFKIAEKYEYNLTAVRYYLQDVHRGEKEKKPAAEPRRPFREQWEAACRKLNPRAWADRPLTGEQEDDAE